MMNQDTRHLSKMPEEVRAEISPWFIEKKAIREKNSTPEKIMKLDNNAKYINHNLKVNKELNQSYQLFRHLNPDSS